jgi:RNA polymerase sigma-70 factor (ECF subfamily)
MGLETEEFAEAIRRCAHGDRQALRLIFENESGRMVAVAQRILRRRDLAEEAVQDAFVQLWRSSGRFNPSKGSPHGWVYAIVRNRALTIWRSSSRETPVEEPHAGASVAGEAIMTSAFDALPQTSALRRCLLELNDVQRRCVLMAHCLGYTHGEIAGRLDAPLGSVKSWVRRGLASLRSCIG